MRFNTKLLIIDMDNTLCDTFHTISKRQWELVEQAFEKKGKHEYAQGLRRNFGKRGFLITLRRLKMSEAEQRFAVSIYDKVEVKSLRLYDDAHALLSLPIPKVLVTRGKKSLQVKKIAHLKIKKYFDRIYYTPTFKSKEEVFIQVLREYRIKPAEALVIGDRIEEEIAAAQKLKIPSCLVLRPDWPVHRYGIRPTVTVKSLTRLAGMMKA